VIRRCGAAAYPQRVRRLDLAWPQRGRERLIDVAIVGVVLGWTILMVANGGLGTPGPATRRLDALGVVLSCASALPLFARRRVPATTYAITALATLSLLYLRFPVDVPLGVAVAAYTLSMAYGANPSAVRRRLALLAVLAFIPAVAVVMAGNGLAVWESSAELLSWLGILGGIWVAGDRTRLRREQVAHLRERVERAKHDAERERSLAAAQERTRIARELHDSAGHAINVILVQAGAARLLHERDPQRSREALHTIEEVARTTIGEIDRMVRVLREDGVAGPPPADPGALEELVARHRVTGLRVTTRIEPPRRPLPDSVAWATYRIVQEALTNAARHGSGEADVAVRPGADVIEISVTNPVTPGEPRPARSGHGIIGMRERATLLGGTLETTERGGMFRLRARLPLPGVAA